VLSMKVLGLVESGESAQRQRAHALWYTAGVLASFLALGALAMALRHAGLALGWGFQLQQPLVVAGLGLLMFVFGLSLSGVWHVGGHWTGLGHGLASRSGAAGDFFTGVLAVVVAAPCTAPLMGPALGWAFTAPTAVALLVFAALGLGLALPFLLVGFIPALARRLPRPGAWMETFKQILAFPMYLAAIWLVWVLANQRGADAVGWWALAALALAFAAWAWTHGRRHGARWSRVLAIAALLAAVWPLVSIARLPIADKTAATATQNAENGSVAFSEQRLADLRGAGRVVLVNMTADWCVTCKANEKTVFERDGFREALAETDAVYMVGDWTDVDPAITAYLQRYRAVGVPLYVVYPRGGGEGEVLPTVLTPELVRRALQRAAQGGRTDP
jgi:thiol:disulfide interchange protein DsbD